MNIFSKPAPFLTPEDLGISLEEDSPDVSDEEVAQATDTDNLLDFTQKLRDFVAPGANPTYGLRRKSGILYSRVSLENGQSRLFNIEWIRKGLAHE